MESWIQEYLSREEPEATGFLRNFHPFLMELGLPPVPVINGWYKSSSKEYRKKIIAGNLRMLVAMKAAGIPIAKWYRDYGVVNFARYPMKAFQQHTGSYVLLVYPHADYNSVYYTYAPLFDRIGHIKIIEAKSGFDAAKKISRMIRRYGAPKSVIVGGHGEANNIRLDINHILHQDTIERLSPSWGRLLKGCPLSISSCSTGVAGGIAEAMSNALQVKVTAPMQPASLAGICQEGRIYFKNPSSKRVFYPSKRPG